MSIRAAFASLSRRVGHAVGHLRGRFFLLLGLLIPLSTVPWIVSQRAHDHIDGLTARVDLAGSLRYRLLQLREAASPDDIARIDAVQRDTLRTLVEGNGHGHLRVRPCVAEAPCERLREHQERWIASILPAAEAHIADRSDGRHLGDLVDRELTELDTTVRLLSDTVEDRVDGVVRTGLAGSVVTASLVLFIGFGVWEVFSRIRRLQEATMAALPIEAIAEHSRGADEVASLGRALGDTMAELRTRAVEDRARIERMAAQQHTLRELVSDVNNWIAGTATLTDALAALVRAVGHGAAWVEVRPLGGTPELLGIEGLEPRAWRALSLPALRDDGDEPVPAGHACLLDGVAPALTRAGLTHVIAVPFSGGAAGEALLGVACHCDRRFFEEKRTLLETFAQTLAVALVSRRLLREREQRGHIAGILATLPTPGSGAEALGAELRRLIPHDLTVLETFDEAGHVEEAWRITAEAAETSAAACRMEVPEAPVHLAPEEADGCPLLRDRRGEAILLLPLRYGGPRPIGALALVRLAPAFSPQEIETVSAVAGIVAAALVRMRLETRLRLAEQLSALGGFSRMLAHEVRNPLNSLSLHVEMLARRVARPTFPDGERQPVEERITVLRGEIDRLNAVVEEYLAMSRGAGGHRFEPVDLRSIIEDVVAVHGPLLGERGIRVDLHLGDLPAFVPGDRVKLQQVLHNVVRNAAEALEGRSDGRIAVLLSSRDGAWEISVRDNGPGIDDPERIFLPSYSTKSTGSGMGLAISRQIARLHRGRLVARQAEGGGAEFVLVLGGAAGAAAPPETPAVATTPLVPFDAPYSDGSRS